MKNNLYNLDTIYLNQDIKTQDDVFKFIAKKAKSLKLITDESMVYDGLLARELTGTTGFEDGLAIPHSRIIGLTQPTLFFIKLSNSIEWHSMDGIPSQYIFSILVPENADSANSHLEILSSLSVGLMDPKNFDAIKGAKNVQEINNILDNMFTSFGEKNSEGNAPKKINENIPFYVAISACTFGLSHTYMVEQKLKNYAEKNGFEIKVQTNGSKGILNKITEEDLKRASGVLLAIDKEVDLSHIEHQNVYKTTTFDALKNTKTCFDYLIGSKQQSKINKQFKFFIKQKAPQSFMGAASGLMNYLHWGIMLFGIAILFSTIIDNDIIKYIKYGTIGAAPVAGYFLVNAFTKSKWLAGTYAFILMLFNVALLMDNQSNWDSLGMFTVLLTLAIPVFYHYVILKYTKKIFNFNSKIRGGMHWLTQILFIVMIFVIMWFSYKWLGNINSIIWTEIILLDNTYWWFRWITAFIFMGLMIFDMGGPINKASIITSSILFIDSFASNNLSSVYSEGATYAIWATPITAQIVGITIPGISLWLRYVFIGKNMNEEEKELSKHSGKSAFNGISEVALWSYKWYKSAFIAHILNVLGCSFIIALLHIQYLGGYNTAMGAIFGLSFDNVLSNDIWDVMPGNMPSINIGFLILNTIGPLWGALVYLVLFNKKTLKVQGE